MIKTLYQLGNILEKKFIIGKSCYNSIELAKYSMDNNASYVSFGAMYPTHKASAIIVRHSILIEAKKIIRIPICVIGGINKSNVKQLIKYKPDMVSMISGIFNSKEIRKEIKDIKKNNYTMKNSKSLFKEANKYIPGGVNSPVRAFSSVNSQPFL